MNCSIIEMVLLPTYLTSLLLSLVFAEVGNDLARLTTVTGVSPRVDMEGQHSLSHLHLITMHQSIGLTRGFGLQARTMERLNTWIQKSFFS